MNPTGLEQPDNPDAKIKFLAAEVLHGVCGLVYVGNRFANELGMQEYVMREM